MGSTSSRFGRTTRRGVAHSMCRSLQRQQGCRVPFHVLREISQSTRSQIATASTGAPACSFASPGTNRPAATTVTRLREAQSTGNLQGGNVCPSRVPRAFTSQDPRQHAVAPPANPAPTSAKRATVNWASTYATTEASSRVGGVYRSCVPAAPGWRTRRQCAVAPSATSALSSAIEVPKNTCCAAPVTAIYHTITCN